MPKYDGVRFFLFFDKITKKAYLVNNFDIIYFGEYSNQYLDNIVLDGEFIDGEFYAFDAFTGPNGINAKELPFSERLKIVKSSVNSATNPKIKELPNWDNLALGILNIARASDGKETDGLIFTSKDDKYFGKNYKYKPTSLLTIDFHVAPGGILQSYNNEGVLVPFTGNAQFPFSGTVDSSLKRIHEFRWNAVDKVFEEIRERPDKKKPNHIDVANNVWNDINTPINENEFLEYIQKFSGVNYTVDDKNVIAKYFGLKEIETIQKGPRDERFRNMLFRNLKRSNLKDKYINKVLDDEGLKLYNEAFTSPSADPVNNYEYYETLGDSSSNQAIVTYLSEKYPKLNTPEGIKKVIGRIKLTLVSKDSYSKFGEKLDLYPYITASIEDKITKKKKMLEDVFEAFMGVTCLLFDKKIQDGVGYSVVYSIIKSILDTVEISLRYEDLYDAKTRLKEIFDYFHPRKNREVDGRKISLEGTLKYTKEFPREKRLANEITIKAIYVHPDGKEEIIGDATGALTVIDLEKKAAEKAIENLARKGYINPIPEIYKNL